jgi:DHA2 family multidrug resistance protein
LPIATAGLVMEPRGVGTMLAMLLAMLLVGRLVGRIDTRLLLVIGLGLTAWPFYALAVLRPGRSSTPWPFF